MLHDIFRTHVLSVERRGRASDGAAGWSETFSMIGTVTGSLQPSSAAETHVAEQGQALARWVLYLDPGAPIAVPDGADAAVVQRDDEMVYLDRRFRVVAVQDWQASSPIDHTRVDLVEVQRGT